MPKVSVIITTYNREKYLREAIDSVLAQTFQEYEIIIVDDGSQDNTKNVVREYIDNHLRNKIIYIFQENSGLENARNKGITHSSGEYVALLDDDDTWLPDKLFHQVKILDDNTDVFLTGCLMDTVDEQGATLGKIKPKVYPGETFEDTLIKGSPLPSTFVIRKSSFKEIGFFDSTVPIFGDLDFYLRILSKHKVKVIDKILACYRQHSSNATRKEYFVYYSEIKFAQKWLPFARTHQSKISLMERIRLYSRLLIKPNLRNRKLLTAICHILRFLFYNARILCSFQERVCIGKTKNILFYEASSGFGGSSNALVNVIQNLSNGRFYPIVATKNYGSQIDRIRNIEIIKLDDYKESEEIARSRIKLVLYLAFKIIPEGLKLFFLVKKRNIALIHVNTNLMPAAPCIIAAKLARIPCICHIRDTRLPIKRERFFARFVSKIIVLNKKAYEFYIEIEATNKVVIIPDGVDLNEFYNVEAGIVKAEFKLDSAPVIGLVGRIVKGKGHKEFILSAKEVLKIKANAKFLIVGDSKGDTYDYYQDVRDLVKRGRLEKSIIFTGWRNDVKNIISDLDILIQASTLPEGFGLTIIEAMALNKPVVATDIPGPSEIVIDGETGFLVPPGDINAMAEKIIFLLDNPQSAKEMGENGRRRVTSCFNIKNTVKKIEELYDEVLKKPKELDKKC